MSSAIVLLRYALLLIAFIAGLYFARVPSYPVYVAVVLLFLLFVRICEVWLRQRFRILAFLAEITAAALFTHFCGGVLAILFCSSLLALFLVPKGDRSKGLILLLLLVMNVSLSTQDLIFVIFANSLAGVTAVLLYQMKETTGRKHELEILYDELRKKHYELEEARKRIFEYAKKIEQFAQIEERNRIAREIHDELGHQLVRMKMMAEAAVQIYPTQSEKAMSLITRVRDQMTDSMESLRSTVKRMKPEEEAVKNYSLEKLMEEAGYGGGVAMEYQISGMPFPLYPSEEFVLYRNAQEAITNAIRHGQAGRVLIHLDYQSNCLLLSISNDGHLPKAEEIKFGLGLSGMEERLHVLGGKLEIQWAERFTVHSILPRRELHREGLI